MADTKYILRYLPLFYEGLKEKLVYIAETSKNPQAADELPELVETAILERLPNAGSFLLVRSYTYNSSRSWVTLHESIFRLVILSSGPISPVKSGASGSFMTLSARSVFLP